MSALKRHIGKPIGEWIAGPADPVAGSICMAGGTYFEFNNPEGSEINVGDIAHALSNICRFTGHVREFYSVAQHSVLASYLVPPEHALAALLHDAAEAYVGDVSTPLKRMLPDYKAIEQRIEAAVLARFGLFLPMHPCIKVADLRMLAAERRDLMPHMGDEWHILRGVEPMHATITPWTPIRARRTFLERYLELTK